MKGKAKKLIALILSMAMAMSLASPAAYAKKAPERSGITSELISSQLLKYAPELAEAALDRQADLSENTLENAVLIEMLKGETTIDISDYEVSVKEADKAAESALDEVGTANADAIVNKGADGKADEVVLNLDPRTAAVIAFLNEMPTEASAVAPEDRIQPMEAVAETAEVEEVETEEAVVEVEKAEIEVEADEAASDTDTGDTGNTDNGDSSNTDTGTGDGSNTDTGDTDNTDTGDTSTPEPAPKPQPTDPSDLAGLTIEEKMMLLSAYQDLVDFKDANADLFGVDVPYNTYKNTKEDGKNPFISLMNLCYIYYDEKVYTVDGVNYAGFYRLNMLGGSSEGDFVTVTLADGTKEERSYMNAQGLYVMLFAFDLSNRYGAQIFGDEIKKDVEAVAAEVQNAKKAANGKLSEAEMLLIVNDYICEHAKLNIDYMMASAAGFVAEEEAVNPYLNTVQSDLKKQLQDSGKFTQEEIDQMLPTLCEGIFNMWETNQIGCLGNGRGLCISYVNSTNYLVQSLHPEIYKNADGSWKSYTEVNYKSSTDANGKVTYTESTDAGYIIDTVDTVINAFAKTYGQSQVATSDHYLNAVKVDNKWYYIDTNYVDAYVESMMLNRGEANGSENHLLFMYCEDDMKTLFGEEHFVSIDGLYSELAVNDDMEHTWFSYINGAVSVGDDGFYYAYDSTDTFADLNNAGGDMSAIMNVINMDTMTLSVKDLLAANRTAPSYAIAKRAFGGKDTDASMTKLVDFKTAAEGGTTVLQNGKAVVNDELTALYEQFLHEQQKYPSIAISGGLYNGKYYFNLSNCVMSYDIKTGEVARVKEYNTVGAKRDKTVAVGANAFTVTKSNPDLTVENHPISAMSITDGVMSVAVATNYAMISTPGWRHFADLAQGTNSGAGFGYEFEETNYQPEYVDKDHIDLSQLESFGIKVIYMDNDNEEFFYSANFNETTDMSKLTGSHTYETVTVAPACGKDGYTEERCSDCGAIKADSRVVNEGSALEHHFLTSNETYYTNEGYDVIPMDADTSKVDWITGTAYICAQCGDSINTEDWDESGYTADQHIYANPTLTWGEDYTTATVTADACDVCPNAKLDCTQGLTSALDTAATVTAATTSASCTVPGTVTYTASFNDMELDSKTVEGVALGHEYEAVNWNWAEDLTTAQVELSCIRGDDTQTVDAVITTEVIPETEHEGETTLYTATASFNDQTFTDNQTTVKLVDLADEAFTATAKNVTYNGKAQTPAVTVMEGENALEEGVDYTVSGSGKKAGTYELTITGTDKKFTGTKTVSFKVKAKALTASKMSVALDYTNKAYTGKELKPAVTVKDGSTKLSSGNYTVTYKNNTKIGKATVTVKGKGNYSGTVTKTFKIVPKAVKLSSLKSSKKAQMTAKWAKGSNITGYQVQYSTKSDFSGAKSASITKAKTVSKTLTKLSKGKKYYVRVRTYKTVDGTKFYSAWSAKKTVTVKK